MRTPQRLFLGLIGAGALLIVLGLPDPVLANGKVTETVFSTSLSEATGIVRIIVAVFGGVIGVLGIAVAVKGVAGKADLTMSLSEHRNLSLKRISQGVVITLIGAGILVAALYLLPEKRTEREVTGKEVIIERDEGRERLRTAD